MKRWIALLGFALASLAASAQAAQAHIVSVRLGDFYSGALHPLTDLQDAILWIALGLLAGAVGSAERRWLVMIFPVGLLVGLAWGAPIGPSLTGPLATAATIVVLGLLLAANLKIPTILLWLVAFGIAVARGAANASDLTPDTNLLLFAAGLACAGYVVMTLVMAITLAFRRTDTEPSVGWRVVAVRTLGGWLAAIGIMAMGVQIYAPQLSYG
jgi:hydrogenase/urease accessory protein HupE